MKKIISLICSILISCAIQAQTIHWITFIDTTDPNVGQIDVYGRQMLYSYFIDENKLMKKATIKKETIKVKCDQDLEEANGFIVID